MENTSSLVDKFVEVLKQTQVANKNNSAFDKLNRANDLYNRLVESGKIKKRGYTLRGIEDLHLINGRKLNVFYPKKV